MSDKHTSEKEVAWLIPHLGTEKLEVFDSGDKGRDPKYYGEAFPVYTRPNHHAELVEALRECVSVLNASEYNMSQARKRVMVTNEAAELLTKLER